MVHGEAAIVIEDLAIRAFVAFILLLAIFDIRCLLGGNEYS